MNVQSSSIITLVVEIYEQSPGSGKYQVQTDTADKYRAMKEEH